MNLKISQIVANPNQPRKYFGIERMAQLRKSIERYGIKNPLLVEETKGGKYLIVDGERRFRAAIELKLKEVPVIVDTQKDDFQRIIEQFHIQEQHETWTPTERASVVLDIAENFDKDVAEIAELLGIPKRTVNRYMSFGKLINRERFQEKGIQIDWAEKINNLKDFTSKLYLKEGEKDFSSDKKSRLEKVIIDQISNGLIARSGDIPKLKDSFKKDQKSVEKYLEGKTTPDSLFVSTKAKGAFHLRNARNNALQLINHMRAFMAIGDVKVDIEIVRLMKEVKRDCEQFITKYDN